MKLVYTNYLQHIIAFIIFVLPINLFAQEERRPENESLLETIKIEAANMEVFPVDMIANYWKGAIYQKQSSQSNIFIDNWRARYELTFDRYLPFFRFKTRVIMASPEEIDDCVDQFEQLSVKEKALVITGIYIFERAHRRSLANKSRQIPNGSYMHEFSYYPFYLPNSGGYDYVAFLLRFAPIDSINTPKWNQWLNLIYKCVNSKDMAFPSFEPTKGVPKMDFGLPQFYPPAPDDNLQELWKENLERCRKLVEEKLGVSMKHFGNDLPNFEHSKEFLQKIYELEQDPARSKFDIEFALRDYWFVWQIDDVWAIPRPEAGNSSFVSKTLGDIADQLLKSRLKFDSSEPSPEPDPQQ
ncbi:MAG: hypothetical protein IJM30_09890 [Thermoguttaceae bacterium]|nr:hypothetical protein [Thermoguttaceae bacterium]